MNEIIRLVRISAEELLNEYDLSIRENEIIYVQSLSYRSLHMIAELLSCRKNPDSGYFVIGKKKYERLTPELLLSAGIYTASLETDLSSHLSVAEWLALSISPQSPFKLYSASASVSEVQEICRRYDLDIDVIQPVWQLSSSEKACLSILRAKMTGRKLVILEVTGSFDEVRQREMMKPLIERLHEEGMSFLILSSRSCVLSEISTRFQHIRYGGAVKEWYGHDPKLSAKLMGLDLPQSEEVKEGNSEKKLIGLCDPEWTDEGSIWQYLRTVQASDPEFWDQEIRAEVPDEQCGWKGNTAVIPRTSFSELIENLSISENLTIALAQRMTDSGGRIIKGREARAEKDFRERFGIADHVRHVSELTRLQRKILSIERFVLKKPEVIILEDPYRSVHASEVSALREYLNSLADSGIRVMYFSRSSIIMRADCAKIIETRNGKK